MTRPLRVFMPCTGLGREQRGFEAFTRSCARALERFPELDVVVFGGGGALLPGEREVWNLPRSRPAARAIAALLRYDPYFVEQLSFFAGFAGALAFQRPDVVYFADLNLGNACWHWRRITGARYRLVYYNGGPTTRPFTRCDVVQQVSPEHYDAALARGESAERQFLLPHGLDISRTFAPMPAADRAARRAGLGIPADAPVVLSVGALNASHKRMDYVIDEVATMASQPYLLLLGATGPETAAIRERAASRLGERCVLRTLDAEMMRDVYGVADVFVLASLVEGFGLAQVEALAAGVPCVAHDSPTAAYVLGEHAVLADLRRPGMLAPRLERVLREGNDAARAAKRHAYAWRKFSWDTLADSYASALQDCAAGRRPADASRD